MSDELNAPSLTTLEGLESLSPEHRQHLEECAARARRAPERILHVFEDTVLNEGSLNLGALIFDPSAQLTIGPAPSDPSNMNIAIVTKRLVFRDGNTTARIVVSRPTAANGKAGNEGAKGDDASAIGATGGRGDDGGNGDPGEAGRPLPHFSLQVLEAIEFEIAPENGNHPPLTIVAQGMSGGRGGNGGAGGVGGRGGPGRPCLVRLETTYA